MKCPTCNAWNTDGKTCEQVKCLACGAEQCHSHGSTRGTCSVCTYGMIPGWSGNNNPDQPGRYRPACVRTDVLCEYAGCDEMAVYTCLPGPKNKACKSHGDALIARKKERQAKTAARYQRYQH